MPYTSQEVARALVIVLDTLDRSWLSVGSVEIYLKSKLATLAPHLERERQAGNAAVQRLGYSVFEIKDSEEVMGPPRNPSVMEIQNTWLRYHNGGTE
jgi:hypothetical protein